MKRESIGKNTIKRKLRSDAGASITFALLLFLVCAVVSAIVLVAATTASGRMANVAEADQRYYAVTSATELMRDLLAEKSVTTMTIGTSKISVAKPANEITLDDINNELATDVDEDEYVPTEPAPGDDYESVERPDSATRDSGADDLAKAISNLMVTESGTGTVTCHVNITDMSDNTVDSELAVTVDATLDSNRDLTLIVYNTNGKPFQMTMEFTSTVKNGAFPPVREVEPSSAEQVTWHLDRVLTTYDASILDENE